jgi:hypothetical protein
VSEQEIQATNQDDDPLAPHRQAVVDALKTWSDAKGLKWDGPMAAFWHVYTGLPLKSATYSSYYGTKEVWSVVVEHPSHAASRSGAARRRA